MDDPGKGLNVTLFVDGNEVANVTTDDNGKFNYTYTPKSIKSSINVTVRFNGTDYHNYGYNASEGSTTFDVAKISTDITADTVNTTTPEENITMSLILSRKSKIKCEKYIFLEVENVTTMVETIRNSVYKNN